MKVAMGKGGVPFVITYRTVIRKPKLRRERKYVGMMRLVKNLLVKAIESFEAVAFETRTEVEDPGQSVSVHWAIDVEDPWDVTTGAEKNLIAYRMLNDIPPSGVHFEIISPPKQRRPQSIENAATAAEAEEQAPSPSDLTPEQFHELRLRQDQQSLLSGTRDANGRFQRPPATAYGQRTVRTLDEELAIEGVAHEEPEDMDGSSSFGEDD